MATNLLWFVMAGFLLGFATSTLWEWFYFRKERLKLTDRRIRELEAKLRDAEADADSASPTTPIPTVAAVTGNSPRTSAWGDTSYRSPGVFLETEEYEAESGENALSGRERARPPLANSATLPTVNNVAGITASPPTTSPAGVPVTTNTPATNSQAPASVQTSTPPGIENNSALRGESPTPADALRAKRSAPARSRQEVLAALRRNSEAVQRGELPRSEPLAPVTEMPPFVPRRDPMVSPIPPVNEEPAVVPSLPPTAPPEPVSKPAPTLPPARQRWIDKPELTQRTQEYPDDLSKIKGIGDVYKQRLYRAGIYTWKQIAEADIEALRRATSAYPSSNVDEWLVQAQRLMEKHGRANAVYSGPQPDDMTKILGIGPVGASTLYRAGICTYEQLATTPIADLEALFPVAVAGDQPDFAAWVARATTLADEKHADK